MKFTISATELNAKLIALAKVMNSKVCIAYLFHVPIGTQRRCIENNGIRHGL